MGDLPTLGGEPLEIGTFREMNLASGMYLRLIDESEARAIND
jgi:hypothetical protein